MPPQKGLVVKNCYRNPYLALRQNPFTRVTGSDWALPREAGSIFTSIRGCSYIPLGIFNQINQYLFYLCVGIYLICSGVSGRSIRIYSSSSFCKSYNSSRTLADDGRGEEVLSSAGDGIRKLQQAHYGVDSLHSTFWGYDSFPTFPARSRFRRGR